MSEPLPPDVEPHAYPDDVPGVVKVCVVGDLTDRTESAQLSAFFNVQFLGTTLDQAVRLLPRNKHRKKAVIWGLPGFANNNTDGNLWVGTREQVQNRTGGILVSGMPIEHTAQNEVWINSDGAHSLTVSAHDEWYLPS
jgi:hypothetical protein